MKYIFAVKHNSDDFHFVEAGAEVRLKTLKQGFVEGFRALGYRSHPSFLDNTIMIKDEDRWTLAIVTEEEWKTI